MKFDMFDGDCSLHPAYLSQDRITVPANNLLLPPLIYISLSPSLPISPFLSFFPYDPYLLLFYFLLSIFYAEL